ncbi:response regulator [Brevundimonas sp. DWR2-3-1b1]|uniref:response regulator n=1 Tax=unclassified Brevundimonas TaxID=2622653 RepID=UPI003CEFBCDF
MVNPVAVAETPRGVLLVEDEFLIRMLLAGHLRESGYMVVEACNGEEAVALLTAGAQIDIVFTDVRMPGPIDGIGLLAYIKRVQPYLPVVMTSGHLDPAKAYVGGAAAFLPKPCTSDEVVLAIQAVLQAAE